MGRQVKRVPLDFDWPMHEVWPGFVDKPDADLPGEEPPAGEGWQMWENTSEGSPISPVFDTPEKLARWLADTNASAFGGRGASYENWLAMISEGSAFTAVFTPATGETMSGVEYRGKKTTH